MKRALLLVMLISVLGLWVSGCSSGTAAPPVPPAVSVALTPLSSTTIVHAQTLEFNAAVAHDSSNAGVTWAVSGGTGCTGVACGTISYSEPLHAHYTAPDSPAADLTATVTATSVKDPTKSASVTVTVWPHLMITTAALPEGARGVAYSATVQSSGGMPALHWVLAGGVLPAGLTLNPNTGVISGTPTTAETQDFTIEVSDAANPAQVADQALSITVTEPPLTITTTSLPDGSVGAVYSRAVNTVGGTPPFTWSLASGSLPSGLSQDPVTGVISGTPDTAGTLDFTVHVVDSSLPQQWAEQPLSIRINPPGSNNAELGGPYVFVMSGYNADGYYTTVVGRFVADRLGNLSEGSVDLNENGVASTDTFNGTYSIGADHRGTMTLNTSGGPILTFAFVVNSVDPIWNDSIASAGRMIQYDTNAWTAGEFRWQAPGPYDVNGSYAFGASGVNGVGMRFAEVGRLSLNGAGGVTGGTVDFNNDGSVGSTTLSGTYAVTANGRATMTLTNGLAEVSHLVLYLADYRDAYLISTDDSPMPNIAGRGTQQFGTPFSNSSLNGMAVNIGVGRCPFNPAGSKATAGLLEFNGTGGVNVSYDENVCGVIGSDAKVDTYAVDANGRVVLGAGNAYLYLIYPGDTARGFYLGTSDSVEFGWVEAQWGAPFNNSSITGAFTYGVLPRVRSEALVEVGADTLDSGNVTGIGSTNNQGVTATNPFNDTYNVAPSGRVTTGSGETIWYLVSPFRSFVINVHAGQQNPQATVGDSAITPP